MRQTLQAFALTVLLFGGSVLVGCGGRGIILSQDGAYENDPVLVNYDETSKAAYNSIHGVLGWADDNRAWLYREVPGSYDFIEKLKVDTQEAFKRGAEARRLYLQAKTVGNVREINSALDAIDLLVEAATLYYSTHNQQDR